MTPELTEDVIAEAMARAENVACSPGNDRRYAFPDPLQEALKTCTPKGRCKVGWIVANAGRDSLGRLARSRERSGSRPGPGTGTGHIPFIRAYGNFTCGAVVR